LQEVNAMPLSIEDELSLIQIAGAAQRVPPDERERVAGELLRGGLYPSEGTDEEMSACCLACFLCLMKLIDPDRDPVSALRQAAEDFVPPSE
jgi:hypothetical protein